MPVKVCISFHPKESSGDTPSLWVPDQPFGAPLSLPCLSILAAKHLGTGSGGGFIELTGMEDEVGSESSLRGVPSLLISTDLNSSPLLSRN